MKHNFLDNLYLVLLYPEEFPYFFEEKKSAISETIVNIISSLSLSISMVYISPPYTEISNYTILFYFFLFFLFFHFHPSLISIGIEYKIKKSITIDNIQKAISFTRYSICVYGLVLPLSHVLVHFNLTGGVFFLLINFLLTILNLFIISRGISSIYNISGYTGFSATISSYFSIIYISSFLFLFLILYFIGILLQ